MLRFGLLGYEHDFSTPECRMFCIYVISDVLPTAISTTSWSLGTRLVSDIVSVPLSGWHCRWFWNLFAHRWPCIHDIKMCVLYRCECILYPPWSFMSCGCQDGTVFDSKMCHFHACFCCLDLFFYDTRSIDLFTFEKLASSMRIVTWNWQTLAWQFTCAKDNGILLLGCSPTKIDQMGADKLFERGSQDHFTAWTDHWCNPLRWSPGDILTDKCGTPAFMSLGAWVFSGFKLDNDAISRHRVLGWFLEVYSRAVSSTFSQSRVLQDWWCHFMWIYFDPTKKDESGINYRDFESLLSQTLMHPARIGFPTQLPKAPYRDTLDGNLIGFLASPVY